MFVNPSPCLPFFHLLSTFSPTQCCKRRDLAVPQGFLLVMNQELIYKLQRQSHKSLDPLCPVQDPEPSGKKNPPITERFSNHDSIECRPCRATHTWETGYVLFIFNKQATLRSHSARLHIAWLLPSVERCPLCEIQPAFKANLAPNQWNIERLVCTAVWFGRRTFPEFFSSCVSAKRSELPG